MFIKLPDKKTVAINLSACDFVKLREGYDKSCKLILSKQFEPPVTVETTIQSYPTYEQAFKDFEKMMDALASGKQVWSPQQ